jgi:hypothetical protein
MTVSFSLSVTTYISKSYISIFNLYIYLLFIGGPINSNTKWSQDEEKIQRWKNGMTGKLDYYLREFYM